MYNCIHAHVHCIIVYYMHEIQLDNTTISYKESDADTEV